MRFCSFKEIDRYYIFWVQQSKITDLYFDLHLQQIIQRI